MSNKKYTCENHKLSVCCLECMKAKVNKYEKLLKFIRKVSFVDRIIPMESNNSILDLRIEAYNLLNEIGELNDE